MIENSMCHDVTSDLFDLEQELYAKERELLRIDYKETLKVKEYKSSMVIGNITINNIKKFNWLQKLMFKIFFGIKIEDIQEN